MAKEEVKLQDIEAVIAEDRFIADVQIAINTLMEKHGMSRTQLAKAIGVSDARVSQLFRDEPPNFTVKIIARIFHALGETPELTSVSLCRHYEKAADTLPDRCLG